MVFKYRVFKSLIKPQLIKGYLSKLKQYRVFKSLIKPQLPFSDNIPIAEYRVFKSLIKPQLIGEIKTIANNIVFSNL